MSPDGGHALVTSSGTGGPGRDGGDVRRRLAASAAALAGLQRPSRALGVLRRRVLPRRHQGRGRPAAARASCTPTRSGRRVAEGDRHDPGRATSRPASPTDIPRAATRLYVADNLGGPPFSTGVVPGSARPRGARDRPRHQQGRGHDRPRPAARSVRHHLQPYRHQGVRHQLDGPFGGRDRHRQPKRSARVRCRRPATRFRPTTRRRSSPTRERHELYVANANSDTVSVIDTEATRSPRPSPSAPRAGSPKGSMPDGLAREPGRPTLYVANGTENASPWSTCAGAGRCAGLIPTAWYPRTSR